MLGTTPNSRTGLRNLHHAATAMVNKLPTTAVPEPDAVTQTRTACQDELVAAVELADAAADRIDFAGTGCREGIWLMPSTSMSRNKSRWKLAEG